MRSNLVFLAETDAEHGSDRHLYAPPGTLELRSSCRSGGNRKVRHGSGPAPGCAAEMLTRETALTEPGMAPAVAGYHHFSPTVSDVEASTQWYERVFGMTRVPVPFPHYGGKKSGYAVLMMDPRSEIGRASCRERV